MHLRNHIENALYQKQNCDLILQTSDKTRKMQHYVFMDWDAEGDVPRSPERFLAFIEKMETASGGPILIHCRYDKNRVHEYFSFHLNVQTYLPDWICLGKINLSLTQGTAGDGAACSVRWRVSWRRSRSNERSALSTPSGGSRPGDPTLYTARYYFVLCGLFFNI